MLPACRSQQVYKAMQENRVRDCKKSSGLSTVTASSSTINPTLKISASAPNYCVKKAGNILCGNKKKALKGPSF